MIDFIWCHIKGWFGLLAITVQYVCELFWIKFACDTGLARHMMYLRYILRHKWFVFLACRKMAVPLWRAIIHDWTKFTPREWLPYAKNFFNADGSRRGVRDANVAYGPNSQPDEFKYAWLFHQRNLHHWQAWVSIGDSGSLEPMQMPETYAREMIADWIGAGRAISGQADLAPWYMKNRKKMVLHPETRSWVEKQLGIAT